MWKKWQQPQKPSITFIRLSCLEEEIEYLSGDLAKVKVFGKIYNIPRQQAGNDTYSNIQIQEV